VALSHQAPSPLRDGDSVGQQQVDRITPRQALHSGFIRRLGVLFSMHVGRIVTISVNIPRSHQSVRRSELRCLRGAHVLCVRGRCSLCCNMCCWRCSVGRLPETAQSSTQTSLWGIQDLLGGEGVLIYPTTHHLSCRCVALVDRYASTQASSYASPQTSSTTPHSLCPSAMEFFWEPASNR
jgi:hypothetical protein